MSTLQHFETDIFYTSAGDLKITFLGHGSLLLAFAGKYIYIDPFGKVADYTRLPKADLVLITHEHFDHLDPQALAALCSEHTVLVVTPACAKQVPGGIVMKNGESVAAAGFPIEAVPAYNPEKQFHPKGNGNGYVLTFGDKRVFVAGDTENVPEIKALKNIDIAFLPMNLPFTMNPEQVADTAKAMRPKILYPYHYGNTDPNLLVNLLKDEKGIEVRIRNLK